MRKIKYESKTIAYTVSKAKVKNLYITIQNGEVVVKAPWYVTARQIQDVVESKQEWITKKLEEYKISPRRTKEYVDGEKYQILGQDYYLNIYYKDINSAILNVDNGKIEIILPICFSNEDNADKVKTMIDKMYYKIAENEVELSMEKMRKLVGLAPEEYKIKKMKGAWGSCSTTRRITINQDLMMYNRNVIDYVVLHEICHLKYMNHSKNFWKMVEKYMPNYKEQRDLLKK